MVYFAGYVRKTGTFPNKESGEIVNYDNYELSVLLCPDEFAGSSGYRASVFPAKPDKLKIIGAESLDDLLPTVGEDGHFVFKPVILVQDLTAKVDEFGKSKVSISRIILDK